jgi:hypothetical protein
MGPADFTAQLQAMGYSVRSEDKEGFVSFAYTPPLGKFAGRELRIAYQPPGDFPLTPPPGPHVSPRLLAIQSGGVHPSGGIHESPLGDAWHYWSRPMSHWPQSSRTARDVIAHLNHLFETQ